jgi:hypothetical protein
MVEILGFLGKIRGTWHVANHPPPHISPHIISSGCLGCSYCIVVRLQGMLPCQQSLLVRLSGAVLITTLDAQIADRVAVALVSVTVGVNQRP